MHSKRYRGHPENRASSRLVTLRIVITVVAALTFAVLFYLVGMKLSESADIGLTDDTTKDTMTDSEAQTTEIFVFKDHPNTKSLDLTGAKADKVPYNTVLVRLSGDDGKLKYLSSVSSLIYGSSFQTTMKPITAVINSADIKSNRISLSFKVFSLDDNRDFADSCSLSLIKELCCYDEVDEIILEGDVSDSLLADAAEYVSSFEQKSLGVLIGADVFDGIDTEVESAVRRYYSDYDFCVIDLTDYRLGTSGAYDGVYSTVSENAMLFAKYSLRVRLFASTDEGREEALKLIEELELEDYEIICE